MKEDNYRKIRAVAQRAANDDGFDRGIEWNDFLKDYRYYTLPRRENRYGYERRCEVVSCEDLSKCQPGTGRSRRYDMSPWKSYSEYFVVNFSRAQVRLTAEMSERLPNFHRHGYDCAALAALLVAYGQPEECVRKGLVCPPVDDPWVQRAHVLLSEEVPESQMDLNLAARSGRR